MSALLIALAAIVLWAGFALGVLALIARVSSAPDPHEEGPQ